MFNHRISALTHNRFVRFRKRVWLAVGLCIVARAGDAALHAHAPQPHAPSQDISKDIIP